MASTGPRDPLLALGPREAQLARLVAAGLSDTEIAGRLGIGVEEVEAALERVARTLRLRSRTELALLAGPETTGGTPWPTR